MVSIPPHIAWFHRIDLGDGVVTPGIDDTPRKLQFIGMPADLTGKTVLDIGAWDGFFSFEAERRGASRVVALDRNTGNDDPRVTREGFDFARAALGSRVERVDMDAKDVSPARLGEFDVVFFLGVLYHTKYPIELLERVYSVTRELTLVESHVEYFSTSAPTLAFYPGAELNSDPTNWFGPNVAAVDAMLRVVGYRDVRMVAEDATRAAFHAFK